MKHMTLTQAKRVTLGLMIQHGLSGWSVRFDNAVRRAGQCSYRDKVISLSKPLMAHRSYDETMMTITHEIAHAIVGPRHGHDRVWQRAHKALGGNGKACYEDDGGLADATAPWVGKCACEHVVFTRYKRPATMNGYKCRRGHDVIWRKR